MKKVILVDDQVELLFDSLQRLLADSGYELVKTETALYPETALEIIKNHPEADYILLDGNFMDRTTCLDMIHRLNREEQQKVICFSDDPQSFIFLLRPYGVRHFPGKLRNLIPCFEGTCMCDSL